jgi:hypothetical protein
MGRLQTVKASMWSKFKDEQAGCGLSANRPHNFMYVLIVYIVTIDISSTSCRLLTEFDFQSAAVH